jgi:hypothetical protein
MLNEMIPWDIFREILGVIYINPVQLGTWSLC